MRRFLAAGVLATLVGSMAAVGPVGAQSNPTTRAAAIVESAVVYLEQHWTARVWSPATTQYTAGYLTSEPFTFVTRCTGFVINPDGYVATAGHCVDPSKTEGAGQTAILNFGIWQFLDVREMSNTEENWNWVYDEFDPLNNWKVHGPTRGSKPAVDVYVQHGVAAGGVTTGESMVARVVEYQGLSGGDVAILKVEAEDLPSLQLAPKPEIEVGTEVLSVGYPGAADEVTDATYTPTFQDGRINSLKTREGGSLPVYEVSSEMTGGMSGGPTTDFQGRVVGINSYGDLSGSYNFLSPVSLLQEMMVSNGVENRLGPVDHAYRAGLDAFFAGDYDRAAYEFDRATGLSPKHKQAQDYLQKSRAQGGDPLLGNPAEQGGGSTLILIIAGAAVLLIGGGLAFFLLRRRRKAPAAAPAVGAASPLEPAVPGDGRSHEEALVAAPVGAQPEPETGPEPATEGAAHRAPDAAGPEQRFCPDCGNASALDARFCERCGHRFA